MGLDSLAVPVMNTTQVPNYTTQLCNTGLPFRINVVVFAEFWTQDDEVRITTFQLPPFMIVPTDHDGIHDWLTFLSVLRQSIEYKIWNIEGLPSGVSFHGLIRLLFLFIPMDNLAAFHAHLPPVVGGCKAKLPKKLNDKHCCLTILNEDEQCLRCCIIAHVLKVYEQEQAGRWGSFLANPKTPGGNQRRYATCLQGMRR
jgi:hypothetical protein